MNQTGAGRARTGRTSPVSLLVVAAAVIGTALYQSASSSASSVSDARAPGALGAVPPLASSSAPSFSETPRDDHGATSDEDGAVTAADGALPDGVTVFDMEYPGVSNLDPDLLGALRDAATDAADDGIELYVNSGWRSPEFQDRLLREAVSKYGSEEQAGRWVATADTSAHVSGNAVDIGPLGATTWLSERGASYGLCQIYRNEPWHYELRPRTIDRGCPPTYADIAHDPSMQP